jgi:16S rRNA (cytosine1402-N4)-methyltransferase
MNKYHTPVLLEESIDLLKIKPDGKYIDATLGGGGHSERILSLGGRVLGIDLDTEAIEYVKEKLGEKISLAKGNFRDIDEIARLNNFEKVDGIIFDFGVSSHQIDTPERGFSFLREGPLDMRMDKDSPVTAEALINLLGKGELYDIFNKFGQDSRSWIISSSIIKSRRVKPIQTTEELARIIEKAYGIKNNNPSEFTKNFANRKVFQALRIAVNSELENINEGLPKAIYLLKEKGRIAVISFHSLEDSIVKRIFKDLEKKNMGKIITEKPIEASIKEARENPRAKSAKLRVFEKN